jgi:hypothetical protein
MRSIVIRLSAFITLCKCLCIVSPECWTLSWTNLFHDPCASVIKHIPTNSSSLICLVCWSPYVFCRTLHNWKKTCGFILNISWHLVSLPVNVYINHLYPVTLESLQGCLAMCLMAYTTTARYPVENKMVKFIIMTISILIIIMAMIIITIIHKVIIVHVYET